MTAEEWEAVRARNGWVNDQTPATISGHFLINQEQVIGDLDAPTGLL